MADCSTSRSSSLVSAVIVLCSPSAFPLGIRPEQVTYRTPSECRNLKVSPYARLSEQSGVLTEQFSPAASAFRIPSTVSSKPGAPTASTLWSATTSRPTSPEPSMPAGLRYGIIPDARRFPRLSPGPTSAMRRPSPTSADRCSEQRVPRPPRRLIFAFARPKTAPKTRKNVVIVK